MYYGEALAGQLRGVLPRVFASVGSTLDLNRSNLAVWTEVLRQGGEHRPDLFVEVFSRCSLPPLHLPEPQLSAVCAQAVWAAALSVMREHANFTHITVETRFSQSTHAEVKILSGVVTEGRGTAFGAGARFDERSDVIQNILRQSPL